nr:hypothetical protein [uncultured Methanoregula sp.]
MDQKEHVHIISAGENIHTAYPAIFRTIPTITRTFVLADSTTYETSSNPEIEKQRLAIRHAVDAVKEISASLSISFSRETVFPPTYNSVRSILTTIHREYPGARFTFDLTGGSKPLCMALFSFASWLGGNVYSAFDEKVPRNVPLPERPVRGMMDNPNYQTILALLLRTNHKDPGGRNARLGVTGVHLQTALAGVCPDPHEESKTGGSPGSARQVQKREKAGRGADPRDVINPDADA